MESTLISKSLMAAILGQYRLSLKGIHGIAHWARVYENGQRLAAINGADPLVAALFAVFHDAGRRADGIDLGHGKRGADLAAALRGRHFELDDARFDQLYRACASHTEGILPPNGDGALTVYTCWDSDRLDLPRAGITIRPRRLSTEAARQPDILAWAEERSQRRLLPDWVEAEWLHSADGTVREET
jgi:uncharacterized protein